MLFRLVQFLRLLLFTLKSLTTKHDIPILTAKCAIFENPHKASTLKHSATTGIFDLAARKAATPRSIKTVLCSPSINPIYMQSLAESSPNIAPIASVGKNFPPVIPMPPATKAKTLFAIYRQGRGWPLKCIANTKI